MQLNGSERELPLVTFSAFAAHIGLRRQELQIRYRSVKGLYHLSSDKMHNYSIHTLSHFP